MDIERAPRVFLIEINPLDIHFHFFCFMIFIYFKFFFVILIYLFLCRANVLWNHAMKAFILQESNYKQASWEDEEPIKFVQ